VSKNPKKAKAGKTKDPSLSQPWISMRTGLKVIAGASIVMAAALPGSDSFKGWVEGILWACSLSALIWGSSSATSCLTVSCANNQPV
jgi:hypothetical protein